MDIDTYKIVVSYLMLAIGMLATLRTGHIEFIYVGCAPGIALFVYLAHKELVRLQELYLGDL